MSVYTLDLIYKDVYKRKLQKRIGPFSTKTRRYLHHRQN